MIEDKQRLIEKARQIKCLITDVDGVMTDGSIIYDNAGMEYKQFNVKDGQIIQYLKANGVLIGVITGRDSQVVKNRCEELKFDFHFHGIKHKGETLSAVLKEHALEMYEVAYIGDDINDLPILTKVGLSATPNDGHEKVKERVDWVLTTSGGKGALRELADLILKAQGKYDAIIEKLMQ